MSAARRRSELTSEGEEMKILRCLDNAYDRSCSRKLYRAAICNSEILKNSASTAHIGVIPGPRRTCSFQRAPQRGIPAASWAVPKAEDHQPTVAGWNRAVHRSKSGHSCPLMGWSGRAPGPPAREAGKGRQRQGARHATQAQFCNRRDRYRYRQEFVSRGGAR